MTWHVKNPSSGGAALSDDTPLVESGSGSAGTSDEASRSDHVHPADGGGGGGGGSELLDLVEYRGDTTVNTTSTSFVDVDATNLVVSFDAPASGDVLVILSVASLTSTAGAPGFWNLREGASNIAGTARTSCGVAGLTTITCRIRVSGLTPGATYTWKWGWARNASATNTQMRTGTVSGADWGPASMEVFAA